MLTRRKKFSIYYVSALSCMSLFPTVYAQESVDQLREQSVVAIRSGQIDAGFQQLESLLQQYPQNQKLLADYIVIAYSHNKIGLHQLPYLNAIQAAQFPEYGQLSAIKTLRDLKQYPAALALVQQFQQVKPADSWQVWRAVLHVESGQIKQARQDVKSIHAATLSADYLAQLSYVYRLLEMPVEALQAAEASLAKQVTSNAQEQYVLALMLNGDYPRAEAYVQAHQLNQSNLLFTVKLQQLSQKILNAVQFYQSSSYRNEGEKAFYPLDAVLAEMKALSAELPEQADLQRRFYYEYIDALNQRNRSKEVLLVAQQLNMNPQEMPAYVRHAIADAYLKLQQPAKAEPLYLSLFKEKNSVDYSVYAGLYYAYIEQEKFKQANQLFQEMDKTLPTFRYSDAKGVEPTTHPDRLGYLSLKGLNYAYRNQHAKAEQYFQNLVEHAPSNVAFQNNLALIQRWREKPLLAEHTVSQWNGMMPISQTTQINQMQNAQTLGDIERWRAINHYLYQTVPDDTAVQRSRKELNDRNHFSIQHSSTWSESKSDQQQLLNQLKGSNEQNHWTRLNSPWMNDYYRLFADHAYRWSKYQEGKIDDQRVGLGLEWNKQRKAASILLSDSVDDSRFGVELDWAHVLNDHWQYRLNFNTQADIPLQAIRDGYEGESYLLGLNWQQNESRKAGWQYQLTDIDDGNTRHATSAFFSQRIYSAPHHLTTATIAGYYGQNDNIATNYFNPERSHSLELRLAHDWMTWRNYEHHLNQHFEATVGTYQQKGYSNDPIYNFFYGHEWQLSRTWKLNYGVGWGVRPYDGKDEEKTYAVLGLEGRF